MHRWTTLVIALAVAFLLVAMLRSARTVGAAPSTAPPLAKRSVIVELFTSEGCSSCPPADELLGQLRQEANSNGAEVIPLGFHVDYWDSSGWHDRFDSSAFSKRQEDYARQFHLDGPYTPQMVIDGETEFVGSLAGRAREVIAQSAAQPPDASVSISPQSNGDLLVQVGSAQPAAVMLAVTEDNLATKVGGGENDGRTLHHTAVVRDFRRIGQVRNGKFSSTVQLELLKDWKLQDLRAIVFVQTADNGRILGASSLTLGSLRRGTQGQTRAGARPDAAGPCKRSSRHQS
ncbi:MAG TPA: DUF1223 domain-containing protein [Candidatus Acidoferrales bacterium]|nr:DUF1223 domain-containing protein [Candidatus Acidoferrales bacterium]